jgi:hypothetical protein
MGNYQWQSILSRRNLRAITAVLAKCQVSIVKCAEIIVTTQNNFEPVIRGLIANFLVSII